MARGRIDVPPRWHAVDVSSVARLGCGELRAGMAALASVPAALNAVRSRRAAVAAIAYPCGVAEGSDASVALIERSRVNGTNRGELAFPGGGLVVGESPEDGALRELHEELGVDDVEVIGRLTVFDAVALDTLIHPIVGVRAARPVFVPDSHEVERVIEVSLRHVLTCEQWSETWGPDGMEVMFIRLSATDVAWGTTALILAELVDAALLGNDAAR
jgi:8-oxo-dGTP pyrophosphatase MutT (NUDIX family)